MINFFFSFILSFMSDLNHSYFIYLCFLSFMYPHSLCTAIWFNAIDWIDKRLSPPADFAISRTLSCCFLFTYAFILLWLTDAVGNADAWAGAGSIINSWEMFLISGFNYWTKLPAYSSHSSQPSHHLFQIT